MIKLKALEGLSEEVLNEIDQCVIRMCLPFPGHIDTHEETTQKTRKAENWIKEWITVARAKKNEGLTLDECKKYMYDTDYVEPLLVYSYPLLDRIYNKL